MHRLHRELQHFLSAAGSGRSAGNRNGRNQRRHERQDRDAGPSPPPPPFRSARRQPLARHRSIDRFVPETLLGHGGRNMAFMRRRTKRDCADCARGLLRQHVRAVGSPQLALRHFARRRHRQRLGEDHVIRHLPGREVLRDVREDRVLGHVGARLLHDHQQRPLRPLRMRHADHRRVGDAGTAHERRSRRRSS